MEFIQDWWGIIALIIIAILSAIFNWDNFKKRIIELIFIAEEQAREKALETGAAKFEWVAENGYKYVPFWAKFVLSEQAFRSIVQKIFDEIFAWAERQKIK